MKKITWMWCFSAMLSLAGAASSQSTNTMGGIEKAVTGLEPSRPRASAQATQSISVLT